MSSTVTERCTRFGLQALVSAPYRAQSATRARDETEWWGTAIHALGGAVAFRTKNCRNRHEDNRIYFFVAVSAIFSTQGFAGRAVGNMGGATWR